MKLEPVERIAARIRRCEAQLVRASMGAIEQPALIELFPAQYAEELHTRPDHFVQVVESIAFIIARTYRSEAADEWSRRRERPIERDVVRLLIMWAVDATDKPFGSAERVLPEQAIRKQAAILAAHPNGHVYLLDLALACAFVGDPGLLRKEVDAREKYAADRIGGNPLSWHAGPD